MHNRRPGHALVLGQGQPGLDLVDTRVTGDCKYPVRSRDDRLARSPQAVVADERNTPGHLCKLVEHVPVGGEAEQHRRFEQQLHADVPADGALLQITVDDLPAPLREQGSGPIVQGRETRPDRVVQFGHLRREEAGDGYCPLAVARWGGGDPGPFFCPYSHSCCVNDRYTSTESRVRLGISRLPP